MDNWYNYIKPRNWKTSTWLRKQQLAHEMVEDLKQFLALLDQYERIEENLSFPPEHRLDDNNLEFPCK